MWIFGKFLGAAIWVGADESRRRGKLIAATLKSCILMAAALREIQGNIGAIFMGFRFKA